MHLAVILTTYNWSDALAAALDGWFAQEDLDFELIVADDGSTADTARRIAEYRQCAPVAVRHVWQEDRGFRAAAIRNRAIATTHADYLCLTDGDCIPRPTFVADHRRLAERRCFVVGHRLLLGRRFTEMVLARRIAIHDWPARKWLLPRLRGDLNRLLPLLRVPLPHALRKWTRPGWKGAKTCNLAVWRDDMVRVNGFEESYEGWGLEDSDLVLRLLRAGVCRKSARFAAPLFHLWHPENSRCEFATNRERLERQCHSGAIEAATGLRGRVAPVAVDINQGSRSPRSMSRGQGVSRETAGLCPLPLSPGPQPASKR